MDIYDSLGVKKYINAHDTYTVYGGSRMAGNTLEAMTQAAGWFVDMGELQYKLGKRIAGMTGNEGAYITNGASGGLLLAAAACMTGGDAYQFMRLPDTTGIKNEIVVMRCQRNAYDAALAASGATLVEVGDADETLDYELEGVIGERTAAVFYFDSSLYKRGSMDLETLLQIARRHDVPVVVDAAAQLPPVENLWKYTKMGADMALFSGGKTLCGPQASGLIVGREKWIDICRRIGAPIHGICRSSKVGREEMVGLYMAIQNYLELDHTLNGTRLGRMVDRFMDALEKTGAFSVSRLPHGPVGQTYPRAMGRVTAGFDASDLALLLRTWEPGIYIGVDVQENAIYISPLNLKEDEADIVIAAIDTCVRRLIETSRSL